jgi:acid phosphatase (class A)
VNILHAAVAAALGALIAACSTPTVPPTDLPELRPGYIAGYLQPSEYPKATVLLPPPPEKNSAVFAADEAIYKDTRKLRETPRWAMATNDADPFFPALSNTFSCAVGLPITKEATPHLFMLMRRVRMDSSRANDAPKDLYKRVRPFNFYAGDPICVPQEAPRFKDDSYPSGHASIGWALALTLAEAAPDRSDQILVRGLEFGRSRVVCGVHWASDVEYGRLIGAATVSRLHANTVFLAQLEEAKKEIVAARAAGRKPAADCDAEARALAQR